MTGDRKLAYAVEAWMRAHQEEMVRDLMELIRIRSVAQPGEGGYALGTGCHLAAQKLMEIGEHWGLQTENDGDYSVSVLLPGKTGGCELGILGHLDVVPEGEGWRFAPFEPVVQKDCVIGRGSCDNKGPVVMALYVLRCLKELGVSLKSDIRLIAGCDEEGGMQDIRHYLQTHQPPAFTLNCDGAWPVCIGEKGILTFEVETASEDPNLKALQGGTASNMVPAEAQALLLTVDEPALNAMRKSGLHAERRADGWLIRAVGKAAHSSAPGQGVNAIRSLLNEMPENGGLSRLRQCLTDDEGTGLRVGYQDRLSGKTTCVPTRIALQDGRIRLTFDMRYAITQPFNAIESQLKKRCEKLGVDVRILSHQPPRHTPADSPAVRLLLDVCRTFLPSEHKPYITGGGTHSRLFPNSVPFGVGYRFRSQPYGGPHAADEAVCIRDLVEGAKLYAVALRRLDEMTVPVIAIKKES